MGMVLQILLDNQALLNPVMRTSKGQLMTPIDAALHRGNRGCAKYLQLHGGVPASKLTDKSARVRGGNQRSVPRSSREEFKRYETMHYFNEKCNVLGMAPHLHYTSLLFTSVY
jgi:hypothetical protein